MFIMSSSLNICTYGKQKYDCGMIDYIYIIYIKIR